jgi:D-alanyl-lipoteichoic acid acyltransferase DltB (MBOAT superfamily)
MLFNSYPFLLVFLPLTLAGFFALGRVSRPAAAAWLTLASLVFYGWWSPPYVALLLASIAFNYTMGARISRARAHGVPAAARGLLIAAVAVDLATLGYFKYANFFLDTLGAVSGLDVSTARIILPLGISFFTFTQIAFLVDTYRGIAREYNPIHFALFVTYFPHLIAGPILHHKEMMPQFARRRIYVPQAGNLAIGATIFAIGLFKKTVLADGIAPFVAPVFDGAAADPPTLFMAWGGALAYTFQLYFDFSGYSDMAIGLSRLFGVQLPLNFDSPYKSRSIVEFWRRWHMTLSRFLRDYVYFALGGNRRGRVRRYVNLFLTMLLGGLWHGAGWTFVAWGALHGIYLAVNHAWIAARERLGWTRASAGGAAVAWLVTFVAVVVGWVLFRAASFGDAVAILRGMTGYHGVALPAAFASRMPAVADWMTRHGVDFSLGGGGQFLQMYAGIAVLAVIALALPNTQELLARFRPGLGAPAAGVTLLEWRLTPARAIAAGALAAAGFLSLNRVSEFLYYQF